jgi:catechol 2,3-dioxygenase
MLQRAGLPRVHIEAAPSRHAVAASFLPVLLRARRHRIEVTTGGYFVFEPDPEPLAWTEAERARGQAWGVKTVESFHYYRTTPTADDREYAEAAGVAAPDR